MLQLPLPLLPPPPSSPSSTFSLIFPSLSLYPLSSSRPLPPPELPLRSYRILLRRDLDPNPDLDPDLDFIIDAPKVEVPLDLFLPLLQGGIDLDTDLALVLQEDPPIPFCHSFRLRRCRHHLFR